MLKALEQLTIGQRVRVVDGTLIHYRNVGTIVAAGQAHDWYVHLDDTDVLDTRILFLDEELEVVSEVPGRSWHEAAL